MKYVLFGAGILGKRYLEKLTPKYDIICIADNDLKKQGTRLESLEIISPDRLPELDCEVIITSRYDVEIAQQLCDMGIKCFFVPEGEHSEALIRIDLTVYGSLDEIPNKVCIIERSKSGSSATALQKLNSFKDLELVTINYGRRDSEYFYHYLTSRVLITQFGESCTGKRTIELWHGFPFKRITYASLDEKVRSIADLMSPALNNNDIICSLSTLCSIFLGFCFHVDGSRFTVTGLPRNDLLFTADGTANIEALFGGKRFKSVIIYAPTYREYVHFGLQGKRESFIFSMEGFDGNELSRYLRDENILLLLKMHPYELAEISLEETENIRHLSDEMLASSDLDFYELLNGVDLMITDYSSVFADYLLLDRPIVFTPLDLEDYSRSPGLLAEPYEEWMPGEIALDFPSLLKAIDNGLSGDDAHAADRHRLRNIIHHYQDAGSSERVLRLARRLCFGEEDVVT